MVEWHQQINPPCKDTIHVKCIETDFVEAEAELITAYLHVNFMLF